jgi:hypothetical protein
MGQGRQVDVVHDEVVCTCDVDLLAVTEVAAAQVAVDRDCSQLFLVMHRRQ